MSKIALVLQLLGDGEWHLIEELQECLGFSGFEVKELMGFLDKYGFATVDNLKLEVKVNSDFQKLLVQTAT
jgi:hypothetical protein